jgi:hypothetical protein
MIPPMQVNKSVSSLDNFRSMSVPLATRRHRAVHCAVATVALLAIGALTVGSAIVVREYSLSRAYEVASCQLVNVTYATEDAECVYCAGSVDKARTDKTSSHACFPVQYPCVRLTVDYTTAGGTVRGRGILYADTMQASGLNTMCSVSVCHKTREDNVRLVEEYISRFTADRKFACFYDSETFDNVIVQKVYTRGDVIHCLLWPSIAIVASALILVYTELVNRGLISPLCDSLKTANDPHRSTQNRPTLV